MSHTGSSAASVALGALELFALLVPALCGFIKAWRVFAHGVPRAPRASWLAALAPWCGARVAAALAATLAREAVPIHVLAAKIAHSDTDRTAAAVSCGALETSPLCVLAVRGRQAASSVGGQGQMVVQANILAQCQESVLFVLTLACRALRVPLRDHEDSKRNDRSECHFGGHLQRYTQGLALARIQKNGWSQYPVA